MARGATLLGARGGGLAARAQYRTGLLQVPRPPANLYELAPRPAPRLRGLGLLILVDGEWTIAEGDWPVTVDFDPTLTENMSATGDNRGCPPGYFCQYVADTRWWDPTYDGVTRRVCRRADEHILRNPGVVKQESGPGAWDQTVINFAAATQQGVEAVKQAAAAVAPTLNLGLLAVIVVGGAYLFGGSRPVIVRAR